MKNLITILLLIMSILTFGQEEIKMPELDTGNHVYTLDFKPDSQNEEVISAYMQGSTEKDSLRFWAEGTILTQRVMVTVLLENKSDKVKVAIVKNSWEDSKISGETKNGSFQESFDTAGKFGIVITSEKPETKFYLAVWTGGERVENINALYRPATSQNTAIINTGTAENPEMASLEGSSNNMLMYLLFGALLVIIFLLAIMVFRKKKGANLIIILALFLGQQFTYAGAGEFSAPGFGGVGIKYPGVMDIIKFAAQLPELHKNLKKYLDRENDQEGEAGLNPPGGPGLPSSCIPDGFRDEEQEPSEDGQEGRPGRDGRDGIDGRDGRDGIDSSSGRDGYNSNDGDSGSDGTDGSDGDDGDDGDDGKYKPNYDDRGRPKYDVNNKPIDYDNSKYPKYDKNGNAIEYGEIDPKGSFDMNGRPRFDKNKEPIEYDNPERPKYDSKGDPINYGTKTDTYNPTKENTGTNEKDNPKKESESKSPSKSTMFSFKNTLKSLDIKSNDLDNSIKYAQASMFPPITLSLISDPEQDRRDGCDCLKREYGNLNFRRVNLEKLRIVYAHAMKKINAGIAFGDGVSAVHGVSALVWQKQKMIILKESIPTLNKAYDDKYAEMMEALEKNLKKIDQCEALLGYTDWYHHSGFIYFQFMMDKYKRN